MRKLKSRRDEISPQQGLTDMRRMVEAASARSPPAPEGAEAGRPQSAPEDDIFHLEMAYRLQAVICADPRRCAKHRCRRLAHCPEIEETNRLLEQARARAARQRKVAGKLADGKAPRERNH